MASADFNGILENAKELDRLKKEQEQVVAEINKLHGELQACPEMVEKPEDTSLSKLKSLYIQAKELSESEVTVSETLLTQLDLVTPCGSTRQQKKNLVAQGNDQKRKKKNVDSKVKRYSSPSTRSQIEAYARLKGEEVAARVTADSDEKDKWYVVKVTDFDRETKEVEVLDEEPGDDDEEGNGQRTYKLPMSCILPFPKRTGPTKTKEFPPGKHVLAVYPGTTALYKATVVTTPRQGKSEEYLLEFEGDEDDDEALPQRTVPFHKVVALPKGHRQ